MPRITKENVDKLIIAVADFPSMSTFRCNLWTLATAWFIGVDMWLRIWSYGIVTILCCTLIECINKRGYILYCYELYKKKYGYTDD